MARWCHQYLRPGGEKLYRNVMAWSAASKPVVTKDMALLNNDRESRRRPASPIKRRPLATTFVTGVAVTLSVQSQQKDVYSNSSSRRRKRC
jgi:hypothetical protein